MTIIVKAVVQNFKPYEIVVAECKEPSWAVAIVEALRTWDPNYAYSMERVDIGGTGE